MSNSKLYHLNIVLTKIFDRELTLFELLSDMGLTRENIKIVKVYYADTTIELVVSVIKQILSTDLDRDRLWLVVEKRCGLGENPPLTLEKLSKEFGVTRERIRQLEKQAIKKLWDSSWENTLVSRLQDGLKEWLGINIALHLPQLPDKLSVENVFDQSFDNKKLKVFLCHASTDKETVRDLYQRFIDEGWLDPWLDEKKILAGQNWEIEIQNTVRNSHVVLVCLSQSAITREGYIQREISLALDTAEEKPEGTIFIIPVRLENCDIPQRLKKYHWVNYFDADGYRQIIKSLQTRAISLDINIVLIGGLTDRESKVLLLVAKGMPNKEIAERLGISHQTVKNHVTAILQKLGVKTRSQAIVLAYQHGLV